MYRDFCINTIEIFSEKLIRFFKNFTRIKQNFNVSLYCMYVFILYTLFMCFFHAWKILLNNQKTEVFFMNYSLRSRIPPVQNLFQNYTQVRMSRICATNIIFRQKRYNWHRKCRFTVVSE